MTEAKKTAKAVNYTTEQEAIMMQRYPAAPTEETVKALAEEFGKATKSIIAKLVRLGVYKKKEYVTKTGEKPVAKSAHAEAIGKILNLSEPDVDSLTKANKSALEKLFTALVNSVPVEATTPEQEKAKQENAQTIGKAIGLSPEDVGSLMRVRSGALADIAAAFDVSVE